MDLLQAGRLLRIRLQDGHENGLVAVLSGRSLVGAVLHGLAQLRAGGTSTEDLATTIVVTTGLLNRLEGVRDAAVRQHAAQGGSYGALASSMDGVTRATAQYRRDALVKKDPSAMEQWATGS
ncbi:hypothetical protein [Streptomyces sp. NPDC056308]|uniref:hypothetical protein n=1 Tax=Streptomyces sp. NPDC056308 TaxID=3345780 RepID=UPI0035DBAA10